MPAMDEHVKRFLLFPLIFFLVILFLACMDVPKSREAPATSYYVSGEGRSGIPTRPQGAGVDRGAWESGFKRDGKKNHAFPKIMIYF
jgi:hypothetical protein